MLNLGGHHSLPPYPRHYHPDWDCPAHSPGSDSVGRPSGFEPVEAGCGFGRAVEEAGGEEVVGAVRPLAAWEAVPETVEAAVDPAAWGAEVVERGAGPVAAAAVVLWLL